jgi:hypothetical protein
MRLLERQTYRDGLHWLLRYQPSRRIYAFHRQSPCRLSVPASRRFVYGSAIRSEPDLPTILSPRAQDALPARRRVSRLPQPDFAGWMRILLRDIVDG